MYAYFNPRAYVRHDGISILPVLSLVFQSTCLREARQFSRLLDHIRVISIHVPT